ncbi:MAG: dTDP-4-dehydrorhamnose 3,5-epimerase family protein [Candidatus Hodarchaeota archaeon]
MDIEGVIVTKLKIIESSIGSVYHFVKSNDPGYVKFGEAYFSTVNFNATKAWKKHLRMTLNLVVPVGKVKFVIYDDREGSTTKGNVFEIEMSPLNYCRLTVPPEVWVGFKGLSNGVNLIQNIADMVHDPSEQINISPEEFKLQYNWK